MAKPRRTGLSIAYGVVAVLVGLSMSFSAFAKLSHNPGAVHIIHEVVGVPLGWFPLLAALEFAGGLGLVVGIFRPKLGVAAGVGLLLYFTCAMIAHLLVRDFHGLRSPFPPFLMAALALALRVGSMPRSA